MKAHSIRFRTNVLYSCILGVILGFFSLYIFNTVRQILYAELKNDLKVKAGQIESFLNAYASISEKYPTGAALMNKFLSASGGTLSNTALIDQLWWQGNRALGLHNDFFRVVNPGGYVLLRSENWTKRMDSDFNSQFGRDINEMSFADLRLNGPDYYGINYPFKFSNRNPYVLQLATSSSSVHRILYKLAIFMAAGVIAMLLMTLSMGSFLARQILKPVTDVTSAADNISQKNLNLRIPEQALDQEMGQLVRSFNRMIERLERAFAHANEFSSNVAHELRTPLAIIKSELELALTKETKKEDDTRVMQVTLEETDRLIRTVKDLLLLAKLEYKLDIFKMSRMDMTEFLKEVHQYAKVLAQEKKIGISLKLPPKSVFIQGDPIHLRRVFFNLIHNAVKFTSVGGTIGIQADTDEKYISIAVKDSGIGIAQADQPRIFEKFYRVHRADQEDPGGSGLGLSIARTVARNHGGDITFVSRPGQGSVFTVVLPVLPV